MAINVPHPLGHKWVGAIPQEEMNLRITLGKGSLRPTFKMVEFKAMQPMGGASAQSDGSRIIIYAVLGMLYFARQLASISPVTTNWYELVPYSNPSLSLPPM